MTAITLSKGLMNVYGADNLNVGNVGQMSGSASFTLSETSDGKKETVFGIVQDSADLGVAFSMAGNDSNISFNGYNINASFAAECPSGYNVELNTINSKFDFSGNRSGAMITTTGYSANNVVALGGGSNAVYGYKENENDSSYTYLFNNLVSDSGYSNSFISAYDSSTYFETTETSYGAYIEGGQGGVYGVDMYNIGGKYGVYNGVGGINIFATKPFENIENAGGVSNVIFGGYGSNIYTDNGMDNLYIGAYAQYQQQLGSDVITMNGLYGIARLSAEALPEGYDQSVFFNGSYNAVFTSDETSIDYNGKTYTFNYRDMLNGKYPDYQRTDGTTWTIKDFYGTNYSPKGYAAQFGYSLLKNVLDA